MDKYNGPLISGMYKLTKAECNAIDYRWSMNYLEIPASFSDNRRFRWNFEQVKYDDNDKPVKKWILKDQGIEGVLVTDQKTVFAILKVVSLKNQGVLGPKAITGAQSHWRFH